MQALAGQTFEEFKAWMLESGEKAFRAKQVFEWLYQKGAVSFQEMSNLPKSLRDSLAEKWELPTLKLRKTEQSSDGETVKFLWELSDGKLVESVLIYSGSRRTVCVSSQVGCPARCAFCASGKQGFFKNLSTAEIAEQVMQINNWLRPHGERVSHIVFMGMGEPLMNIDAVLKTIHLLTHPDIYGISQRRITVSTVGVVEGMKRLTEEENLKVNLVLSLHAPNQKIRRKIIPYARIYPIEDVINALDAYAKKTKRDITYEYILIDQLNDQPEHAKELAQLVKGRQCTVNLIPYNPVEGLRLKRPTAAAVRAFREELDRRNVVNTCRYTKGDDIAAACGQLALQENEASSVAV